MRLVGTAALVLSAAAALAACGSARELEQQSALAGDCSRCHVPALGPPLELDGRLVTSHEFHVERGVACEACHPGYDAGTETVNPATHGDGAVEATVEDGPYTAAAAFSDPAPTWPATCSRCHTELPPL